MSFVVETAVPNNGGPPSIAVDAAARPWIGFAVGNTMQFGVRDEGNWSFETVPFDVNPKTGIVIDSQGSPAVGRWGGSGTLHYVHKNEGQWVSESTGEGYFPEASALAVDQSGRPYAICIWSYHYYGFVTLTHRPGSTWTRLGQWDDTNWFNPGSAAADLVVDHGGAAHAVANPVGHTFLYIGPGDGAPFPDMKYFAIAVNSRNEPVVVYYSANEIQIMTRETGLWAMFPVAAVDECGRVDVAIDGNDIPHVVYCDQSGGERTVVYARRDTYAGDWRSVPVDAGSNVSLAVDGSDRPHVAFLTQVGADRFDVRYATVQSFVPVRKSTLGSVKALYGQQGRDD